jgi:hypothetical protein
MYLNISWEKIILRKVLRCQMDNQYCWDRIIPSMDTEAQRPAHPSQ